ncbi:hypothetical protein DKX38_007607 [Salix brachista]|uniref:RWP-RK domain-containing protein n=1 Tax=Salix brachista TaxID=2182728 RepID=A0A5N5MP45_9ROSI|nr:hypothetical protein DKX38_007607 [Salix brachista]
MEFNSVDASFVGDGNGKLWNVPDSRADMFKNKSLTLMETNQLMSFFMGREGENFGRGFGEAVYRLPVENVFAIYISYSFQVYKCFQGIDVSCLWSRGSATSPAVKGCIYVGSTEGNCRGICTTRGFLRPDMSNLLAVYPLQSLSSEKVTSIRDLQISGNLAVYCLGRLAMFLIKWTWLSKLICSSELESSAIQVLSAPVTALLVGKGLCCIFSALCDDPNQGKSLLNATMNALLTVPNSFNSESRSTVHHVNIEEKPTVLGVLLHSSAYLLFLWGFMDEFSAVRHRLPLLLFSSSVESIPNAQISPASDSKFSFYTLLTENSMFDYCCLLLIALSGDCQIVADEESKGIGVGFHGFSDTRQEDDYLPLDIPSFIEPLDEKKMNSRTLKTEELVRSLHVYRLKDGKEKEVEREFVFSVDGPYVEMKAGPMLRLRRFQVLELFEGQVIGLWRCIFAFHVNNPSHLSHSSFLLSISRSAFIIIVVEKGRIWVFPDSIIDMLGFSGQMKNPKLKSIPTLAKDIHFILKLSCRTDNEEPSGFSSEGIREVDRDNCHHSKKSLPALDQDLNCLPYSVSPSELSKSKRIELCAAGVMEKKKKRAASEDIARIALEDVVKHFGQPIVEASRNLKVGLTVLKRKCRELGIPRWPHRKIKSLDSLIRSLQEAERHEQDKEDTTMAVAKRRRMLESEKETIEKKPFMEIQSETKRFRQDVFKRRHRARALGNQGL